LSGPIVSEDEKRHRNTIFIVGAVAQEDAQSLNIVPLRTGHSFAMFADSSSDISCHRRQWPRHPIDWQPGLPASPASTRRTKWLPAPQETDIDSLTIDGSATRSSFIKPLHIIANR
jgi:hypothetical protein